MVDPATFLVHFPEFSTADTGPSYPFLTAKIAEADSRVDANFWTSTALRDLAVMYRTAHLLALSPYGMQAKLVAKDGTTTYGRHYDNLVAENGSGAFALSG